MNEISTIKNHKNMKIPIRYPVDEWFLLLHITQCDYPDR